MDSRFFPEVLQVVPGDNYTVYAYFNDGTVRCYDASELVMRSGILAQLRDRKVFVDRLTVMNGTVAWDIAGNENWRCKKAPGYQKGDEYTDKYDTTPNFNDLLDEMKKAVDAKGFGDRLGGEYSGSLIARFSNLTKGVKGAILNCRKSIDFDELAEQNVIIEMEDLKSSEDKALLMGFILARLTAVIRNKHRKNPKYRHITLVEEAHRLLRRYGIG